MPKRHTQTKILDELAQQKVCAVLALGCSRKTAADYLGCGPALISKTARRNPQFAEQLAKAESACEVSALTQFGKALKDERNWRAVAWLLERRFPDRYGRRKSRSTTPRQVAVVMNQLIDVVSSEITDLNERKRIVQRMQSVVAKLRDFDEDAEMQ